MNTLMKRCAAPLWNAIPRSYRAVTYFCFATLLLLPGATVQQTSFQLSALNISAPGTTGSYPVSNYVSFTASGAGTLDVVAKPGSLCTGFKMFVEVTIGGNVVATWFLNAGDSPTSDDWPHNHADTISISTYAYSASYPPGTCTTNPNVGQVEYY